MKYRISLVSYLNSIPFEYGIENSEYIIKNHVVSKDIPSVCAEKLLTAKADLGLIPVAVIPELEYSEIVSNYCIGSENIVKSVILVSQVPLNKIETILLDYQSRTSIVLCRILAKFFWQISPNWLKADEGYENNISDRTAGVIIGDRTFCLSQKFNYVYDLAEQWKYYTQKPFVFACWVANRKLTQTFINEFNKALNFGLQNIQQVVKLNTHRLEKCNFDLYYYLTKNISYDLTDNKLDAMKLFFDYQKIL